MVVDADEETHVTGLRVVTTAVGNDWKVVDVHTFFTVHAGTLVEDTLGLDEGDDFMYHLARENDGERKKVEREN